jgi:hypothetical protein
MDLHWIAIFFVPIFFLLAFESTSYVNSLTLSFKHMTRLLACFGLLVKKSQLIMHEIVLIFVLLGPLMVQQHKQHNSPSFPSARNVLRSSKMQEQIRILYATVCDRTHQQQLQHQNFGSPASTRKRATSDPNNGDAIEGNLPATSSQSFV